MSVRIKATTFLPEMFGTFVGFASRVDSTIFIVEISGGNKITVHDSDVAEFFYS